MDESVVYSNLVSVPKRSVSVVKSYVSGVMSENRYMSEALNDSKGWQ